MIDFERKYSDEESLERAARHGREGPGQEQQPAGRCSDQRMPPRRSPGSRKATSALPRASPRHAHEAAAWRKHLKTTQQPFATILACSDSRVPPELVFDQGFGDLFVIRVAGNIVCDGRAWKPSVRNPATCTRRWSS